MKVMKIMMEKDKPVKILIPPCYKKGVIRNCLIERENGELIIRPFRGLRKLK